MTRIRKYSDLGSVLRRLQQLTQNAEGYLWTILPAIKDTTKPTPPPPEETWELPVSNDGIPATLHGLYTPHPFPRGLVIIVPGLGASPESAYCHRAAITLLRSGYSSLRLGSVRCPTRSPDFHRLELADQLTAALSQQPLNRYPNVILLGYSIGGHSALRAVATGISKRVSALALVSTPFDLARSQAHLDKPIRKLHRRYFLSILKDMYKNEFHCGHFPEPPQSLFQAQTMREMDATLASLDPRTPNSIDAFYQRINALRILDRIEMPVLAVQSPADPMVPSDSVHLDQERSGNRIDLRWHTGGHIYFPSNTDLGEPGPKGLLPQMITWWEGKALPTSGTDNPAMRTTRS